MEEKKIEDITPVPPSTDECNLAMLAHLLGIFSSFVGPLVIWLLHRNRDSFVGEQVTEALNFQITMALGLFLGGMLFFILIGLFLIPLLLVINFILCIIGAIAASKGQSYRYPFALRLVR